MNRKFLGIAVTLLAIALLASPVVAIGPQKAAEVGNNPHMVGDGSSGLVFMTGASGNTFMWFNNPSSDKYGMIYHDADTAIGEGRVNNALIVDWDMFMDMDSDGHPELYYNKWLYFSNEPVPTSEAPFLFGNSILWGLGQYAMGGQGNLLVANHPDGIFAMWHFVK